MSLRRSARVALVVIAATLVSGCTGGASVDAQNLTNTLVEVANVDEAAAACAAAKIFAPDSGFSDRISEAEKDLDAVPGFEDFAMEALRECGAIPTQVGPTLGGG